MSDFEPKDIDDADEDTERRQLGVFPNPSLDECPVVFLGYHGGRVVFALPEGEIRDEPAEKVGRLIKVDIFNSQAGQAFLGYWRGQDDKFQRDVAATWFIRQCRAAGLWDKSRPTRGLGVWPGPGGAVVLHRGSELWEWKDGALERTSIVDAMRRRSGPIYALKADRPAPDSPATANDGRWLRQQLDLWRFELIGEDGLSGADVLAGWMMAAALGAVAPFRPHLAAWAMFGSGKTTLMQLVHAALSAITGDLLDSFSPAGFRQDLAGMARPVLLDEAEASPDGAGAVEQALEVIRRMATGEGGMRKQGDASGGSTSVAQTAVGAVMMAAISLPKLGPADASRIVQLRLINLDAPDSPRAPRLRLATDAELQSIMAQAERLAPAFLGRALQGAARYRSDVSAIKAALVAAHGNVRTADLIAALAAGRRLLMHDEPLDDESAVEEAGLWRGLIEAREVEGRTSNPGVDALMHLFNWPSGIHRSDRMLTIGECVRRWARRQIEPEEVPAKVVDLLKHKGIILSEVPEDDSPGAAFSLWITVANSHPELDRIYERTRWRDYRQNLAHIDAMGPEYATRPSKALRYGLGIQQRGLSIPLDPWVGR